MPPTSARTEPEPASGFAWHTPSRRSIALSAAAAVAGAALLYGLLPNLAGLDETWRRLGEGRPAWLVVALVLEAFSFAGYVVVFRGVAGDGGRDLGWGLSYRITMAGVAATRMLATAGAGGIALTAWALHRVGMAGRVVGVRLTALLIILYSVFIGGMVAAGLGLATGLFPGGSAAKLTLAPAALGASAIALALALAFVPDGKAHRWTPRRPRRLARVVVAAPDVWSQAMRLAIDRLRRGDVALLGAVVWWACDMAVLWAAFEAFGTAPPLAVVAMGYLTGMLANLLPLPGGVGGVEGGMIGSFIALGVPGGLAIVAVLTYRAYAFWLPTLPGIVAFVGLRKLSGPAAPETPA